MPPAILERQKREGFAKKNQHVDRIQNSLHLISRALVFFLHLQSKNEGSRNY